MNRCLKWTPFIMRLIAEILKVEEYIINGRSVGRICMDISDGCKILDHRENIEI